MICRRLFFGFLMAAIGHRLGGVEPRVLILGPEALGQWREPAAPVHVPTRRTRAYAGQPLLVGVRLPEAAVAAILQAGCGFTFTGAGPARSSPGLKPVLVRPVAADPGGSPETWVLAVFDPAYALPADAPDGSLRVQVLLPGAVGPVPDTVVEIWSSGRGVTEGAFKDMEEVRSWMETYYQQPEPYRLLQAFRTGAKDVGFVPFLATLEGMPLIQFGHHPPAFTPADRTFFRAALKSAPWAAQELLQCLGQEDSWTQRYGLECLREAGFDLTAALSAMPKQGQEYMKTMAKRIPPVPDPFARDGHKANAGLLWSLFQVDGNRAAVQALAGLMAVREGGKPSPDQGGRSFTGNQELLAGLAREHPLMVDELASMNLDPALPEGMREGIGRVLTLAGDAEPALFSTPFNASRPFPQVSLAELRRAVRLQELPPSKELDLAWACYRKSQGGWRPGASKPAPSLLGALDALRTELELDPKPDFYQEALAHPGKAVEVDVKVDPKDPAFAGQAQTPSTQRLKALALVYLSEHELDLPGSGDRGPMILSCLAARTYLDPQVHGLYARCLAEARQFHQAFDEARLAVYLNPDPSATTLDFTASMARLAGKGSWEALRTILRDATLRASEAEKVLTDWEPKFKSAAIP